MLKQILVSAALIGTIPVAVHCVAPDSGVTPGARCVVTWSVDNASERMQRYRLLWESGRLGYEVIPEPGGGEAIQLTGGSWRDIGPFREGDRIFSIDSCSIADLHRAGFRSAPDQFSYLDFVLAAPRDELLRLGQDWEIVLERDGQRLRIPLRDFVSREWTP